MGERGNFIHPSAAKFVKRNKVRLGVGVVVCKGVRIGKNVYINNNVVIQKGAHIGNHVGIQALAHICVNAIIEDDVFIGPSVSLAGVRDIRHGRGPYVREAPVIKRGARIGVGAIILPGVVVGEECLIGAGAVVTKSTEPFGIYMGCPARKVGVVEEKDRLKKEMKS